MLIVRFLYQLLQKKFTKNNFKHDAISMNKVTIPEFKS